MGLLDRIQHGWNAFMNKDPTYHRVDIGPGYTQRPDRPRLARGNERSLVGALLNRMAIDVASLDILHCRIDENGRYDETIKSPLNNCLTVEANIDQTGRAFKQDVVMSMLDEGCVAIAPIETSLDPSKGTSFDIYTMRTAKVMEWFPQHVKINIYNERTGQREDKLVGKRYTAIIENPFYAVMNEPNSTLQRLIRKLNLLDVIDEQSGSGKLDMIIQLPYTIKSELRQQQAEKRRADIVDQLKGPFGIAYIDGTEKVIQLNRPIENNLMKQIEYLMSMLYSQLGITQSILDGTADEQTLLNYYSRTIEPIATAIINEMSRKFLTAADRSDNQNIAFFRDPFKLVPVNNIADIADKFTRNEILTSNEIRQIIGFKPSKDPKADQLINSNLNHPEEKTQTETKEPTEPTEPQEEQEEIQNGE